MEFRKIRAWYLVDRGVERLKWGGGIGSVMKLSDVKVGMKVRVSNVEKTDGHLTVLDAHREQLGQTLTVRGVSGSDPQLSDGFFYDLEWLEPVEEESPYETINLCGDSTKYVGMRTESTAGTPTKSTWTTAGYNVSPYMKITYKEEVNMLDAERKFVDEHMEEIERVKEEVLRAEFREVFWSDKLGQRVLFKNGMCTEGGILLEVSPSFEHVHIEYSDVEELHDHVETVTYTQWYGSDVIVEFLGPPA